MDVCVLNCTLLKAGDRKQHPLLCPGRANLVIQHLNILAFNLSMFVFAFNQDKKVCAERREADRDIDDVASINAWDAFEMLAAELAEQHTSPIKNALYGKLVLLGRKA